MIFAALMFIAGLFLVMASYTGSNWPLLGAAVWLIIAAAEGEHLLDKLRIRREAMRREIERHQ